MFFFYVKLISSWNVNSVSNWTSNLQRRDHFKLPASVNKYIVVNYKDQIIQNDELTENISVNYLYLYVYFTRIYCLLIFHRKIFPNHKIQNSTIKIQKKHLRYSKFNLRENSFALMVKLSEYYAKKLTAKPTTTIKATGGFLIAPYFENNKYWRLQPAGASIRFLFPLYS